MAWSWSSLFYTFGMLHHWQSRLNVRKLRLFEAASTRQVFPDRLWLATTFEHFADGLCSQAEYDAAWAELDSLCTEAQRESGGLQPPHGYLFQKAHGRVIVGDLLGDLIHPVPIERSWLTWNDGTPERIARRIYEAHRFDELPILADALEEAGCDRQEILAHCRQPGVHYRGCWVVDMILDRP